MRKDAFDFQWLETRWGRLRVSVRGNAQEPAVLLVPDPPNTLEHLADLIERLSPDQFVIAFEGPGFGYSKARRSYGYSFQEFADIMIHLLEHFRARDAVVATTCISGIASLVAARKRPDLISFLVLGQVPSLGEAKRWAKRVDFKGILGTPILGQLGIALGKRWVARTWYKAALPKSSDTQPILDVALDSFDRGARFSLAAAFQALKREKEDHSPVLQRAIFVWGLADRTHRGTNRQSLKELVPNSSVRELPDCGHFPDLEKPDEFAQAIREVRNGEK